MESGCRGNLAAPAAFSLLQAIGDPRILPGLSWVLRRVLDAQGPDQVLPQTPASRTARGLHFRRLPDQCFEPEKLVRLLDVAVNRLGVRVPER